MRDDKLANAIAETLGRNGFAPSYCHDLGCEIAADVRKHLVHHATVTRALKATCEDYHGRKCGYPGCGCANPRRKEANAAMGAI